MKKILITFGLAMLVIAFASGCENWKAKKLGGEMEVHLPKGEKLVGVTWKDSNLWYLTKPMSKEDNPETYKFREDSNLGMLEGTVTFIESK